MRGHAIGVEGVDGARLGAHIRAAHGREHRFGDAAMVAADLEDNAYGYRAGRGATDAVKEVHRLICRGYTDVVDADLTRYFDTIPHADLMQCVARRIVDQQVLRLIKLWLEEPIEERDGDGRRRMSGGKSSTCGTPSSGRRSTRREPR